MGELVRLVRSPAASNTQPPSQAKTRVKEGLLLFLWGLGLGLLPLALGLPLAVWGKGFVQAVGVLLVGVSPIVDLVGLVTLLVNKVPRWLWIGALFGLLLSTALVAAIITRLLTGH
jgi:hypothetical protein